jgi:GrpB-like predicted nucleotidyltransferase (UPF0157 family)
MNEGNPDTPLARSSSKLTVVAYDPAWPIQFEKEKELIFAALGQRVTFVEHIGSTAVPGLAAKPIIDVLVGVQQLGDVAWYVEPFARAGYVVGKQEMPGRWFFKKNVDGIRVCNLHIVPAEGYSDRHELVFRDYLRNHPEAANRYRRLKLGLAAQFLPANRPAYTRAKTEFVQDIVNLARADRGLPPVTVWEE